MTIKKRTFAQSGTSIAMTDQHSPDAARGVAKRPASDAPDFLGPTGDEAGKWIVLPTPMATGDMVTELSLLSVVHT